MSHSGPRRAPFLNQIPVIATVAISNTQAAMSGRLKEWVAIGITRSRTATSP
ncbi:MAG: hypothetical protein ACRENX_12590 [Candidatus Dormibacteria bacterium]